MEILSPEYYKTQNPSASLNDYLTYLEEKQKEAEEAFESAKFLSLDDSILEEIKEQSTRILKMAETIEGYMSQIVIYSINQLSLEELLPYFQLELQALTETIDSKKQQKSTYEQALASTETNIRNYLQTSGKDKIFYEAKDTELFFQEPESLESFYEVVLSNPLCEEFETLLGCAIEEESKLQNKPLLDKEKLMKQVLDFLEACRKVIEYSPSSKKQLAKKILSEEGIEQFLKSYFKDGTSILLTQDMMYQFRFQTAFYQGLSQTLKEQLKQERCCQKVYQALKQTYQTIKAGNPIEYGSEYDALLEQKGNLDKQIMDIQSEIEQLENKKELLSTDEDVMKRAFKEKIESLTANQLVSLAELEQAINKTTATMSDMRVKIQKAIEEYSIKAQKQEQASSILASPEYQRFFEQVEMNNRQRIYRAMGIHATEAAIKPFLDAEKKRYQQISKMISFQTELEDIYSQIQRKKEKANFFTRKSSAFKKELGILEERYHQVEKDAFLYFKEKNLFHVEAPHIGVSVMENEIALIPQDFGKNPESFEEMAELKQIFWDMSSGIDSQTKDHFLEDQTGVSNWDSYVEFLMEKQRSLIKKLFQFSKNEEGYYTFECSNEDRQQLLKTQNLIIDIADSTYEMRKRTSVQIGIFPISLDQNKVEQLESLLGAGSNLSRENLVSFTENNRGEMKALKQFLLEHQSVCMQMGIELPFQEEIDPNMIQATIPMAAIQNMNIEGITTLEQAIAYKDFLSGLQLYQLEPEQIKQFYLAKK